MGRHSRASARAEILELKLIAMRIVGAGAARAEPRDLTPTHGGSSVPYMTSTTRPRFPIFLRCCDNCNASEERVFTDSWTGQEFCLECLSAVARHVTNSPQTEGDNLAEVMAGT